MAYKKMRVLSFICLFFMVSSLISFANAGEPPSIIILVNNAPEDFSIVMIVEEEEVVAKPSSLAWENYYAFYASDMKVTGDYVFRVRSDGQSFDCTYSGSLDQYNEVLMLDLETRTLSHGLYPFRTAMLVFLRLVLTLIIEGLLFRLFGYKERRSWLVFLVVNLITQGGLNYMLTGGTVPTSPYMILLLIVGEGFVYITELISMPLLIKEHRKRRTFAYVFLANTLSLFLGGFLIFTLPL